MFKRKKGVALMMVLGVILVVTIFANIIITFFLSHSRLTHHQIGRIQAYYASIGAMNYAFDMLRIGSWTVPSVHNNLQATLYPAGSFVPPSVTRVDVAIRPDTNNALCNSPNGESCIIVTTTYTVPR